MEYIIKVNDKENSVRLLSGLQWLGMRSSGVGTYKHGNEFWGAKKGKEFDYLSHS